jgi:hypothetical protein
MVAMRSVRRYEQGMRILITLALITMLVAFVGVGVSVYQYKNTRTTNVGRGDGPCAPHCEREKGDGSAEQ